jgi:hypothetical protein
MPSSYDRENLLSPWRLATDRKNVYVLCNITRTRLCAEYYIDFKSGVIYCWIAAGSAGHYSNFEFDHFKRIINNIVKTSQYKFIDEKLLSLL